MFETHSFSELTDVFAFKMGGLVFKVGSVGEMAGVMIPRPVVTGNGKPARTLPGLAGYRHLSFLTFLTFLPYQPKVSRDPATAGMRNSWMQLMQSCRPQSESGDFDKSNEGGGVMVDL
jgi:hypothetical protein